MLTAESQAWAARNALLMGVGGDASPSHLVHAPFSLLPSPLPRSAYEQGVALAEINNRMVENIASDEEYLRQTLKGAPVEPALSPHLKVDGVCGAYR
jgi:hypothetical protein